MFPEAGDDEEAWVEYRLGRRRTRAQDKLELKQSTGRWLQINERLNADGGRVGDLHRALSKGSKLHADRGSMFNAD
jgi:hypothetical protein